MTLSEKLQAAEGGSLSNAEVAAHLQSIALAIRLFGLDALPSLMHTDQSSGEKAEARREGRGMWE